MERRRSYRGRALVGAVLERGARRLLPDEAATSTSTSTWTERAHAVGWHPTAADVDLLRAIDELAAGREDPRIAVVTDQPQQRLALLADPDHRHAANGDLSALHASMARLARYDIIVLDTVSAARRRTMILRLLPLTKPGGHLVVSRVDEGVEGRADSTVGYVADLLDGFPSDRTRGLRAKDRARVRKALASVRVEGDHLVLTNRTRAWAKLDEPQVNQVLEESEGRRGRVLHSVPGRKFTPRAELRESESPLAGSWAKGYDAPTVYLREYLDVRCTPGQVAAQGAALLPDTFRHIGRPRSGNRYAPDITSHFSTLRYRQRPQQVLAEPHFYWDSEFRGHFGHAMTEQLSRLWAFAEAKERYGQLKVLMAANKGRELAGFEVAILEAFGAVREDISFIEEPVVVERLVAATPMLSQPLYIHPEIKPVWDRLSDHLVAQAPDGRDPARFFVGRRHEKRACRNADEVEALFASHGFEIVYPEDHPLPVQARMFRNAEVIAGYAGSGLFNTLLATEPKHLILVSSESYTAENEWMIAAVQGHRIDVAWCEAEIKMKKGGPHISKAFHSPYTFDMAREGVFVRSILADL